MGKGGGGQRTPYEAPNDLSSRQKISLIDLISEGPIEGPEEINNVIDDLTCVYLDDTPVIDGSGNSTVNGMTIQWRSGTLEQPALQGFTSSANEVPVGIEMKCNQPVTRTITAPDIDRLRLTFGTQSLVESKANGDSVATTVRLIIQIQRNGSWITEKNISIAGKRSNSPYLMAVILDNLPPAPFSIRMTRLTSDSHSDRLRNNTVWSGYSELIDINQIYPGSAVAGLTFESEQFGNKFPRRNYLIKGRIIPVPSNYHPDTRQYTGIWDGTFKPSWTDNPAWVLWDLLTHPRYGLGQRLKIAEVDKFALYMIGQYCDREVDDGFGGREPRVRCNAYITDLRKAYDVISELCSSMRIMPVWNGQMLTFVQDRASDSVWPYTNANVAEGVFEYSFSPVKARHNIIEVRFVDPDNGWKTSIEQVSDDISVAKNGRNVLRVSAFGCTSRGQAHRHGLWILTTEKLETRTVEFKIGAEGLRHTPGDIFEVADNDWVAAQIGGRILSVDHENKTLLLDRDIEKPVNGDAYVSLIDGSGMPKTIKVIGYPAGNQIIPEAIPEGTAAHSVWALTLPSLRRRLFRAVSLADNGDGSFTVTAVQHEPAKEAIVDKGAVFEPKPDTPASGFIPPVENLTVEITSDNEAWQAEAAWNSPYALRGMAYHLKLLMGERVAGTAMTKDSFYRFSGMPEGDYTLVVTPQNDRGQKGEPISTKFSVNPPEAPSQIDVAPGYFSLSVVPRAAGRNSLRNQYEFWFSEEQIKDHREIESAASYLGNGSMWVIQGSNLKAGQRYFVYVRSVNIVGKSGFTEGSGIPESHAGEILQQANRDFQQSDVIKQLNNDIGYLSSAKQLHDQNIRNLNIGLKLTDNRNKSEIKGLKDKLQISDDGVSQAKSELSHKLTKNQQDLGRVESDLRAQGNKITEIKSSDNSNKSEIRGLKVRLQSNDTAVSNLKSEVNNKLRQSNQVLGKVENELKTQSNKIAEIKSSDNSNKSEIRGLKGRLQSNDTAVSNLKSEVNNKLRQNSQDIDKITDDLRTQSNLIKTDKRELTSATNKNISEINRIERAYTNKERSWSQTISEVKSSVGEIKSSVLSNTNSITTLNRTFSQSEQQVQAVLKSQEAVINTKTTAMFEQNRNGYALHSVNAGIRVHGIEHKAGMVIGAEVSHGKVKTSIGFSADSFAFYNPATKSMDLFMYIKNGQVFMRESFINKAWLNSVVVSNKMESDNYIPGKKGFIMDAKKNSFEMNANEGGSSLSFNGSGLCLRDSNGNIRIEIGLKEDDDESDYDWSEDDE